MEEMPFASLIAILLVAASAFADVEATLRELEKAHGERLCQGFFRELGVGERRVRTEVIHPTMENGRFNLHEEPSYRSDAIYIGISNHDKEGTHHYYLKAGNTRIAGAPLFKAPIIKKKSGIATKGALFEVVLPPEMVRAFEARARAGKVPRGVSCLHTLCSFLEEGGVVVHEREGARKVRAKVVVANLIEGKIKISGQDADPETVRLLLTNEDELQHLLERATVADRHEKEAIVADIILYGKIGGAGTLVLVGTGGAGVWANKHFGEPPVQKPKYRPLGTIDD